MNKNLKNSLLFFVGFFIVLIVIAKLFGLIAFYVVFSLCAGYLIGDSWGFNRGRKTGRIEKSKEIFEEFERADKFKQHKKLMERTYGLKNK